MPNIKDEEKKNIVLSIRKNVWIKYKRYCKKNDLVASYEVQNYMRDETQ